MPRPGSSSRVGAGAFILLCMVGVASASSAEKKVSMQEAALSNLSLLGAQKKASEEDHTAGAAAGVPAAFAPSAAGVKLVAPAGKLSAPRRGVDIAPASTNGARIKLMSTSQREALSARLRDARAAAGDLEGTADDQPPRKMVGTRYDVTGGTPDRGGGHRRRELQTSSCAAGSGVTVTSSEFPLLEGCLAESEDARFENGQPEFSSATGLILAGVTEDDLLNEYWFAFYGNSVESTQACNSEEPASTVHPSEATWVCFFPDDTVDYATSTTFGVDCGCDDDSGSLPAPTPSPVTPTLPTPTSPTPPTPTPSGTCADGSGVSVASSEFPLLEGCLVELDVYINDGVEFVSTTGAIVSSVPDGETTAYWLALYGDTAVPDQLLFACMSGEASSTVHPSEATWVCSFADGTVDIATYTEFDVDCGCDDDSGSLPAPTPSPLTPTPPTPTTPTPPTPTPSGTCAAGSGVTVTSSEFPLLEGCLQEIDLYTNEGDEFASDTGIIVYDLPDGETTPLWFAFYGNVATGEDLVLACNSADSADLFHPSEATWICDFPDGTIDYATSTTFGVDCGCDEDAVSPVPVPTEPPIEATPSPTPGSRDLPITPAPEASPSTPPTPAASGGCTTDASLGVTSTLYPSLEGCLEEVVLIAGGEVEYASLTGAIFASAPDETSALEFWFAVYGDVSVPEELELACYSQEVASTVHPSEATWMCWDAAGNADLATGSDFVVECGCSTAPAPATSAPSVAATSDPAPDLAEDSASAAPTPSSGVDPIGITPPESTTPSPSTPSKSTPSPSSAATIVSTCGPTESFRITSSALPAAQGCFQSTDESFSDPDSFVEVWTVDGSTDSERVGVVGWKEGGEIELDAYPYFLAFVSSEDDATVFYCRSSEEAITVHPVDATWECDLDGTGVYADVADDDVLFTCGCTGTPAPAASTTAPDSAPTGEASTSDGSVAARMLDPSTVAGAAALVTAAAALAIGG